MYNSAYDTTVGRLFTPTTVHTDDGSHRRLFTPTTVHTDDSSHRRQFTPATVHTDDCSHRRQFTLMTPNIAPVHIAIVSIKQFTRSTIKPTTQSTYGTSHVDNFLWRPSSFKASHEPRIPQRRSIVSYRISCWGLRQSGSSNLAACDGTSGMLLALWHCIEGSERLVTYVGTLGHRYVLYENYWNFETRFWMFRSLLQFL